MQHLLKILNSNKELSKQELETLVKTTCIDELSSKNQQYNPLNDNLKFLIDYKHVKTWDNIVIYAARDSNLNLLKLLFEEYKLDFSYTNKDGKNALHEVNN